MKQKKGGIFLLIILAILIAIIFGTYWILQNFNVETDININLNEKNESEQSNEELTFEEQSKDDTQIANPASVYCEEQNHTLELRINKDKGAYGVCIDSDENECEEWAYYRNECELNEEQA